MLFHFHRGQRRADFYWKSLVKDPSPFPSWGILECDKCHPAVYQLYGMQVHLWGNWTQKIQLLLYFILTASHTLRTNFECPRHLLSICNFNDISRMRRVRQSCNVDMQADLVTFKMNCSRKDLNKCRKIAVRGSRNFCTLKLSGDGEAINVRSFPYSKCTVVAKG